MQQDFMLTSQVLLENGIWKVYILIEAICSLKYVHIRMFTMYQSQQMDMREDLRKFDLFVQTFVKSTSIKDFFCHILSKYLYWGILFQFYVMLKIS